jgi:DNA-binding PadR family transcriptional regulator
MELREDTAMTTTAAAKLTTAMIDGLASLFYVQTYSWTEGRDITHLAEHGGVLKGRPACSASTREALERRRLLVSRPTDHGRVYQITDAGIEVLRRELLTAQELSAIDAYLVDQARAEDLLRAQHADKLAEQRSWFAHREIDRLTSELGRQRQPGVSATQRDNWALRRDVFAQLADTWLELHPVPKYATAPAYSVAMDAQRCEQPDAHSPHGWSSLGPDVRWFCDGAQLADQPEIEERYRTEETTALGALAVGIEDRTLPELIQLYAKTWHRAANQPSNPELADQCHALKLVIADRLAGLAAKTSVAIVSQLDADLSAWLR